MTLSGKFAVPIVSGVTLFLLLEPPPEPHAPATRAKASKLAPTAPLRCNRMGRHPSCCRYNDGGPRRICQAGSGALHAQTTSSIFPGPTSADAAPAPGAAAPGAAAGIVDARRMPAGVRTC